MTKRYSIEFYRNNELICNMLCGGLDKAKDKYKDMCSKMQDNKFYTSVELAEVTYKDNAIVDVFYMDYYAIKQVREVKNVL